MRRGDKINKITAETYLEDDLSPIIDQLGCARQVRTLGQLDALADFAFNLGMGRLLASTLWKRVQAGAPVREVQREFRKWVYVNGKRSKGLEKRREWEAAVYAEDI